jgi:DNA invertase Pin-like site-specific DNA recombinase
MKYGYARVSTDGQSIDAQVRQLKAAGARQVFREVASGAKPDRAQLRRVLAQLDAGDVLMVTRLDRLARFDARPLEHPRDDRRPGCRISIA